MTDGKNPEEDKPSFFDFSDEEEASSWPPSESQPTEEPVDPVEEVVSEETLVEENSTSSDDDDFNIEDLFSDSLDDAVEDINESVTEAAPEIDLVPIEPSAQDEEPTEDIGAFESIAKDPEPEPELELDLEPIPPAEEEEEESILISETVIEEEPVLETPAEPSAEIHEESVDALFNDYTETNYAEPEADPEPAQAYQPIEEEEETLAFRTFTTYDYVDEAIPEGEEEEEEKAPMNRNVLIVLAVLLIVGGWYGFQAMFSRDYKAGKGRERRAPRKKTKSFINLEKELVPVWELSSQDYSSKASENDLVATVYENSGRDNPFLLPNSVIADMIKAAELELIKKQKPNTYRRRAYRATLVGVLTSAESTLAVVNFQEAVFDVLEGTSKEKILKLATKAMDKSKENAQEMLVGSYIGPWQIKIVEAPEDSFVEPRITIEHDGQRKILNMGKAVELGIFDEQGVIDNLEEPVEEISLDDFEF